METETDVYDIVYDVCPPIELTFDVYIPMDAEYSETRNPAGGITINIG